jgi:exodeoxyribonuclease-5
MKWSPQQASAIDAVARWLDDDEGQQVFRLFGWAGTGKSTLARHLAKGLRKVCYAAFTGKAALVMRKNGCADASTIHSLIYKLDVDEHHRERFVLNPRSEARHADLIVIDEVSMVNEELAADLLSFGRKVLVLGDPFQLPPVKGAGYFTNAEPDVMLTEIHRQAADNPIIRMSIDVREGNSLVRGADYGACKVITQDMVNRDEVLSADQILCGMNKTRIAYNDRIRKLNGMPYREPVPGDRLVCLKNNHQKGLLNGQIWTIDDTSMEVHHGHSCHEMLIRSEDLPERGSEDVFTPDLFFHGRENEIDRYERRNFDEFYFGYALTVHKAQGSQWDNVYLFDESGVFRDNKKNHLYTAITRAAETVTVVL